MNFLGQLPKITSRFWCFRIVSSGLSDSHSKRTLLRCYGRCKIKLEVDGKVILTVYNSERCIIVLCAVADGLCCSECLIIYVNRNLHKNFCYLNSLPNGQISTKKYQWKIMNSEDGKTTNLQTCASLANETNSFKNCVLIKIICHTIRLSES